MKKLILSSVSFYALVGIAAAQQLTVEDKPEASTNLVKTVKQKLRDPFAAAGGVTNKSSRLIRESLNATKIRGILHTADGKRMAVLKVGNQTNPLFVSVGSTFSVKVSGKEWRDVEVKEISKFEVKVAPKGIDGKIIIR